jgi:hypothetical protein
MRFLLRLAFWLTIVAMLLPHVPKSEAPKTAEVDAFEAMIAASAAFADLRQFCERRPEACAVGTEAASALGEKAQAGAKMFYEFLSKQLAEEPAASPATPAKSASTPGGKQSQSTLTPADLAPPWRGPSPRKSAADKRAA